MNLKTVDPTKLNPHPDNPNQHPEAQIDALGESLDEFDQIKNIVVWNDTIIAGHGVVEAAIKAGRQTLQAHDVSHLSYEQATALMLADIRLPDMAFVDDEVMAEALRAIGEPLEIPGFDEDFLRGVSGDILAEDYEEFEEQLAEFDEFSDVNITITIPQKHRDEVIEWLSNGEAKTSPGMGKGVLRHCGLL